MCDLEIQRFKTLFDVVFCLGGGCALYSTRAAAEAVWHPRPVRERHVHRGLEKGRAGHGAEGSGCIPTREKYLMRES